MSSPERTRQQLDPAGSIGVRFVAAAVVAVAFGYSATMTLLHADQVNNPLLAGLALAAIGGAGLVVIFATSPARAPFSRLSFSVFGILASAAIVLSALSTAGTNEYVRDDWGAIAFGMMLVALGPYRPVAAIAAAGALGAILVGFITVLEVPSFLTPAPPAAFILVAITPMLALCVGTAAYSGYLVRSLERWQRQASRATVTEVEQASENIARSVREDRVTILERDVLPFFGRLLDSGRVTAIDRDHARHLAESIRSVMVEEADRSWLEALVALVVADRGPGDLEVVVDDPHRHASAMSTGQRTSLRTMLMALIEIHDAEPSRRTPHIRILISATADSCVGSITAPLESYDYLRRLALAPYLAVLRAEFHSLETGFTSSTLTVRFGYERG